MSARDETTEERAARLQEFANRGGTIPLDEYRKKSRRAFMGFVPGAAAAFAGFKYLQARPEQANGGVYGPATDNIPGPLRSVLDFNEDVWSKLDRESAQSRTYAIADREDIRVNGTRGMRGASGSAVQEIDLAAWSLTVVGVDGNDLETIDLAPVQALESHEMVWEHKCVEGWSNIVHWTGARFRDFAARYDSDVPPDYKFISMRTPDDGYYVGIDRATSDHNQTLLAWALNGETLTQPHGAPLRLATPLKYGIKQIKRIGTIEFTNTQPDDYWGDRGYDWHAGF